ncbi:putative trihelix transcription factor GTL1-like [Cocos nucifera]|uniref:Putative trihelix transcription factor GTL1-like n=1 Tax=Cocos nucifera TaxID=13894 RepID=A0A8K0IK04_COCNU|nr:putative trihelix transcription factor GTL1-like [Cocos nucifera]
MPSLELASFSSPKNEAQPQIVEISGIDHLQQQSLKTTSSIEMMFPSITTKNFEESDLIVVEIFPNKENALLSGEEIKKDLEIESRWAQQEILTLLKTRIEMDAAFEDVTLKGPLWEDIAMGMQQLGYNQSAKKCKEKWENINKYFKKVKESNKNRPENSGTCPYFNQLDAFYHNKSLSQISRILQQPKSNPNPSPTQQVGDSTFITMLPSQLELAKGETSNEGGNANNGNKNKENFEDDVGCNNTTSKKVHDAGKELIDPSHQAMIHDHNKLEEPNEENIDQEDDNKNGDLNEYGEDGKM